MTLVAGLAIAGLAGIVAAFYYSVRRGSSRIRTGAKPGRTGPGPMTGPAGADPMTGPGKGPAPLVAERRTVREASTGPRRRVGWRKGTDIDQEFWPIEAFGGVSDEQFWDELAADRPLATTARTAQADSGPGAQPARAYPVTRPAASGRIAVQAAVQAAVRAGQAAAMPSPVTTQAYPARTQPSVTATRPVRTARRPADSRGRRSATAGGPGTDEDPLTSPAYSLRAKGAVDGRSYQSSDRYRADPLGLDRYSAASSASARTTGAPAYQLGPGFAGHYGGTAGYPYRGQSTQVTRSTSTPPYGDRYGYRHPVGPSDDRMSTTGNRGKGGPGGNGTGGGHRGSHRAHPPVNGYGDRYDPQGSGRR